MDFGKEEILHLLKRSLVSNTVLTDVCFPDACKPGRFSFLFPGKDESFDIQAGKEISLKLILNKENNDILYAEAGVDFINQLFSFLTFPLGTVLRLISYNLFLGSSINNLYSSAESMGLEYFKSEICRNMLLNPKLPAFYGCNKNQILQSEEITTEKLIMLMGFPKCYLDNGNRPCISTSCEHGINQAEVIECNPKSAKIIADAGEGFVVGSQKFMISNNLQVSPLSIISSVGHGMNIAVSDLTEKEVSFDNVKARRLLVAMLSSKTVLEDVFSSED